MNLPVWAAKNRVGNSELRPVADTGFRDLLSFMLPKSELDKLKVARKGLAISDIAQLKNLDLTAYSHRGEINIYSRWIESADKAFSLAKDLTDWMNQPDVDKFKKIYGGYKYLIGSGYESTEETGSEVVIGNGSKLGIWEIKAFDVARATLWYLSTAAPPGIRINRFDIQTRARQMIEGFVSDAEDKRKEQAIINYIYSPRRRLIDMIWGMVTRLVPYGVGKAGSSGK
jgi:hypothetical protein